MVRFVIIGIVVGVALVLYALVDAAMSDPARARGVPKPVWVVMIVLLPVVGALLWLAIGKARGPLPAPTRAPDDDPRFTATRLSSAELDAHVEELEARLRELDDETFPDADRGARPGAPGSGGSISEPGGAEPSNVKPSASEPSASESSAERQDDLASGDAASGGEVSGGSAKPEGDTSGEAR